MSRFLAPIHSWLFNKIIIFEQLEELLISEFEKMYGNEVSVMVKESFNKYGLPLENKPLEELIDTSNIHGWLQDKISIAETRQSAILTKVFSRFGEDSERKAFKIYSQHGASCGSEAKARGNSNSAREIFNSLNNYILDGMPCDNVNSIVEEENEYVIWRTSRCLHKSYWESVGADVELFYSLRKEWITSFVEASNAGFTYLEKSDNVNGITITHKEIKRK